MKDLIQKKLESYKVNSADDELNALKEITQEVVLYCLYKADFFSKACFLGGTNLRILYGMDRFSEDLDFSLIKKDANFDLDTYLQTIKNDLNAYGYTIELDAKDLRDKSVQSRFLKDDSIKNVLTFKYAQDSRVKIKIKIEIDTNPPLGANYEVKFCDFPVDFSVLSQDLPTLMSGKLHAILCRPYSKGRDWYDFLWYVAERITPNYLFLENALFQMGPWAGEKITCNEEFLRKVLADKVEELDWKEVQKDVRKFLRPERIEGLKLWSRDFFLEKIKKANF